jgi:hypothetical protein
MSSEHEEQTRCFQAPNKHLDQTQQEIVSECDGIKELLLAKNRKYGNSAANPARVFAPNISALEQIAVRCDDKLKRIQNMGGLVKVIQDAKHADEDTVMDLIGYLHLARVVYRQQAKKSEPTPRG